MRTLFLLWLFGKCGKMFIFCGVLCFGLNKTQTWCGCCWRGCTFPRTLCRLASGSSYPEVWQHLIRLSIVQLKECWDTGRQMFSLTYWPDGEKSIQISTYFDKDAGKLRRLSWTGKYLQPADQNRWHVVQGVNKNRDWLCLDVPRPSINTNCTATQGKFCLLYWL